MTKPITNMQVTFSGKFTEEKPLNKELTLCKVQVLAEGKNRNGSFITQDAINSSIKTLFNSPLIAHLYEKDGKRILGGHDEVLIKTESGYEFKSLCTPYGVVPESSEPHMEKILDPDGVERDYLCCSAVLWTGRFPEIMECMKDGKFFNQSVEINVNKMSKGKGVNEGYMMIEEFDFSALTLLGASVEPCFYNALVEPLGFSMTEEFSEAFKQLKQEIASCFSNTQNTPTDGKGGEEKVKETDNKDVAPDKEGEATTDGNSNIAQDNTQDKAVEPTSKASDDLDGLDSDNDNDGATDNDSSSGEQSFSSTYKGKYESLVSAVSTISVYTEDYVKDYYLMDFDDKYVYVDRFLINVDKPAGESTKGRMLYEIGDNEVAKISEESFETVLVRWLTLNESRALDTQREELEALRAFKAEKETEILAECLEAIKEEFDDLKDDAEFKTLVEGDVKLENITALKKELYALRGIKASPKREAARYPVSTEKSAERDKPYAGFVEKYKNKFKGR